jgi:hypothetical protein
VGLSTLLITLLVFTPPANACGCGVYIPREGEGSVVQERALIRWDGQTEEIVMALGVQGQSSEAAWIMPVPAEATVQLGQAELFDALQELTKPKVEQRYGIEWPLTGGGSMALEGAVGGAPPVMLLKQQTLGPFEISTLAATDAAALSQWLADNGYSFPDGLTEVLRPYVEQEWFYIAARLTPGAADEALTGELDPLWITFPAGEIVYPMRATALATGVMPVYLYVLAEHRVEKAQTFGDSHTPFAEWIDPASLPVDSPLRPFVDRKLFLTKFEERIWNPQSVTDDFMFTFAAQDEEHRDVKIEYVYDIAGVPTFLWLCGGVCLVLFGLLGGLGFGVIVWRRKVAKTGDSHSFK